MAFATLVGVLVFSVMWSELLMTSAISCHLWSSVEGSNNRFYAHRQMVSPHLTGIRARWLNGGGYQVDLAATKACKAINILKVLTSTKWGKHKETILATYKAITRPVLEYASTIWSPIRNKHRQTTDSTKHCS